MSAATSYSESESQSSQNIAPQQAGFLTDLWQRSANLARSQETGQRGSANSADILRESSPAFSDLLAGPGGAVQEANLGRNIEAMAGDVRKQLTESFLPALTDNAVAAGGIGSPRGALAAGQATGEAARAVGDFSAQLRSDQYNQDSQRQLAALTLAPGLAQAQGTPEQLQFAPSQNQSAILGSPTVLGQSSSNAWGFSQSASAGGK